MKQRRNKGEGESSTGNLTTDLNVRFVASCSTAALSHSLHMSYTCNNSNSLKSGVIFTEESSKHNLIIFISACTMLVHIIIDIIDKICQVTVLLAPILNLTALHWPSNAMKKTKRCKLTSNYIFAMSHNTTIYYVRCLTYERSEVSSSNVLRTPAM